MGNLLSGMNSLCIKKALNLVKYNHLLHKRINKFRGFYEIFVIFSLILISFSAFFTLRDFRSSFSTLPVNLTFVLVLFIALELVLISGRNAKNTIIIPKHITVFPISKKLLYNYFLINLIFDIKLVIFLIPLVVIQVGLFEYGFMVVLVASFLLLGFFLTTEIMIVNFYLILYKLIENQKKNLIIFPFLMIQSIFILDKTVGYEQIAKIPVLGWVGKSISSAIEGNYLIPLLYMFYFLIFIIAGVFIGRIFCKRIKYIYS